MTRTDNFILNTKWKTISQILIGALNMLNRYVFMHWMGAEYLGAVSLFNSILGILSFADLGLSSAFAACFYRAIAKKEREHCISLLNVLALTIKKCVLIMLALGLLLLPFIPRLAVETGEITDIQLCIYYVLFLLDVVLGYLYTSKVCYVSACQQEYVITPLITLFSFLKILVGVLAILLSHSYGVYLVLSIFFTLSQRITLSIYIGKKYPETRIQKKNEKINTQDKATVFQNVKATLSHKFAGICVAQTDSILLSIKTGIIITGVVSNYVAIKTIISNLLNLVSESFMPSLGNVIATEEPQKQLEVYYTYLSLNMFLTCGGFIGLSILSSPFIELLFGKETCISQNVVLIMNASAALMVINSTLNFFIISAGKYYIGMWVVWIGAFINLVVSCIAVNKMGIIGVYLGTLVSEVFVYILKPIVVMKKIYKVFPWMFYRITTHGIFATFILYIVLRSMQKKPLGVSITWVRFGVWVVICGAVFMIGYSLLLCRDHYFQKVVGHIQDYCRKISKKFKGTI